TLVGDGLERRLNARRLERAKAGRPNRVGHRADGRVAYDGPRPEPAAQTLHGAVAVHIGRVLRQDRADQYIDQVPTPALEHAAVASLEQLVDLLGLPPQLRGWATAHSLGAPASRDVRMLMMTLHRCVHGLARSTTASGWWLRWRPHASSKTWPLVAAILGSSITYLDATIVTVALPRIGRELPVHLFGVLEAQSYVYTGYLLAESALIILAGALSDALGRRRMF